MHPVSRGRYPNLADPRLGAEAVSASDDFFGPKERQVQDSNNVWHGFVRLP
jgi:allantoicase